MEIATEGAVIFQVQFLATANGDFNVLEKDWESNSQHCLRQFQRCWEEMPKAHPIVYY